LNIWLESIEGGAAFVLAGTERSNATIPVIENDLNFVMGAPLVQSINDDIVLLFVKNDKGTKASLKVSAQVVGRDYPFWE